jgi:hypothetical protein
VNYLIELTQIDVEEEMTSTWKIMHVGLASDHRGPSLIDRHGEDFASR